MHYIPTEKINEVKMQICSLGTYTQLDVLWKAMETSKCMWHTHPLVWLLMSHNGINAVSTSPVSVLGIWFCRVMTVDTAHLNTHHVTYWALSSTRWSLTVNLEPLPSSEKCIRSCFDLDLCPFDLKISRHYKTYGNKVPTTQYTPASGRVTHTHPQTNLHTSGVAGTLGYTAWGPTADCG